MRPPPRFYLAWRLSAGWRQAHRPQVNVVTHHCPLAAHPQQSEVSVLAQAPYIVREGRSLPLGRGPRLLLHWNPRSENWNRRGKIDNCDVALHGSSTRRRHWPEQSSICEGQFTSQNLAFVTEQAFLIIAREEGAPSLLLSTNQLLAHERARRRAGQPGGPGRNSAATEPCGGDLRAGVWRRPCTCTATAVAMAGAAVATAEATLPSASFPISRKKAKMHLRM